MNKKVLHKILAVVFLGILMAGCKGEESVKSAETLSVAIREINKHGNVILNVSFDEMNAAMIEIGDIITVKAGSQEYDLPVGTAFTDVDSGNMVCRFDLEDNEVMLGINYGSFAEAAGLAKKQTIEEDPGYKWDIYFEEIELTLKEKKGYLDEYNARHLTRTDAREDYPALSDEEFANFRAISVSNMKENILYRSSTPLEAALSRNEYAMVAMENAGIRTVINLDDSADLLTAYESYPGSYYSQCAIIHPEMGYDFENEEFATKVKESVQFIIENDGPYLIHCKEGKDRTGILCAILECFVGASSDDVARDYMITYYNYYGVKADDAIYQIILNNNLVKTLSALLKIDRFETADLQKSAEQYLASIGLTDEELDILSDKLVSGN